MPKLRRLSGRAVVRILRQFGFTVVSQRGSHMKLKRTTETGAQTLTIPAHKELDPSTLRAIVRQASRFVPAAELHARFFK